MQPRTRTQVCLSADIVRVRKTNLNDDRQNIIQYVKREKALALNILKQPHLLYKEDNIQPHVTLSRN